MGLIQLYRLGISPILGSSCRYYPTCSHYSLDAIKIHGPLKGTWLAIKRVTSCHPLGGSGFDPVPGSEMEKEAQREKEI